MDYKLFVLDIEEEKIHLVSAENISLDKLPSKVPTDSGRYHLYKFKHTHEGDYMENIGRFIILSKDLFIAQICFSVYLFYAWI